MNPASTARPVADYPDLDTAISKLLAYCRINDWAGYDPYDALNSPIFRTLPFLDRRLPRLVLTQVLKRSPISFRSVLQIPKTQNPKAIALFLSAFLALERVGAPNQSADIGRMIERLRILRSPSVGYWCWGYSFPWQTRTVVVASGAPNLVSTTFAANALLEAYEQGHGSECFSTAVSAAEYVLNELYWTDDRTAGFGYPLPSVRNQVHNANLLAAALLCRIWSHNKEDRFLLPALQVARYSAAKQLQDGSWHYGEAPSQRWIDNFHTGYNLCALQVIARYAQTAEFDTALQKGFEFYRGHFFRQGGSVRYFHDRDYPIDVHCVAQSILTLLSFRQLAPDNPDLAHSVFRWALKHLWDDSGFFYYRVLRSCTIRTPYMRWSQAWMLKAMVTLLEHSRCDGRQDAGRRLAGAARRADG